LNPDTVTHPSTNRARRRVTSLIRPTSLQTAPNRHRSREIVTIRYPPLLTLVISSQIIFVDTWVVLLLQPHSSIHDSHWCSRITVCIHGWWSTLAICRPWSYVVRFLQGSLVGQPSLREQSCLSQSAGSICSLTYCKLSAVFQVNVSWWWWWWWLSLSLLFHSRTSIKDPKAFGKNWYKKL